MTKENKYIKEFRELWNNEMFKLQGKYPPEFCCYMNGVCKRITDKLLKSQRKEIIEKIERLIKDKTKGNPLPTIEEGVAREIISLIKEDE